MIKFVYQDNQYKGALLPCSLVDFNRVVDGQDVAWRIMTGITIKNIKLVKELKNVFYE